MRSCNSLGNIENINKYFKITQHPRYHELGDLTHYMTNDFFKTRWKDKLEKLYNIAYGLVKIHSKDIIHKDYHSGNIFINKGIYVKTAIIGDLGLSKSS